MAQQTELLDEGSQNRCGVFPLVLLIATVEIGERVFPALFLGINIVDNFGSTEISRWFGGVFISRDSR